MEAEILSASFSHCKYIAFQLSNRLLWVNLGILP